MTFGMSWFAYLNGRSANAFVCVTIKLTMQSMVEHKCTQQPYKEYTCICAASYIPVTICKSTMNSSQSILVTSTIPLIFGTVMLLRTAALFL